ncbi:nucleotidyltransferase family protein [Candidatus Poriferisodalis sp.]|uniref:nucleotidyltransferase family protein n=1 Tax=Candidatus Poriferisodalis sp. TaxID=3101277 RepID=UPI003D0C0AB0
MTTAGVLLAAGAGTRFAAPEHKLLSVLDGRTVVSRSLEALLEADFDAVAIVTGAVEVSAAVSDLTDFSQDAVTLLHNERWDSGIASSLLCATDWAAGSGHDAIVVGLGDQPFVPTSAWNAVASSAAPIAVATYDGLRGNPVRLSREVWPFLERGGDEGARTLMRRLPELVLPVACEGRPDDIDTVEDLRRWN